MKISLSGVRFTFPHFIGNQQTVKLLFRYPFSRKVGSASALLIRHASRATFPAGEGFGERAPNLTSKYKHKI